MSFLSIFIFLKKYPGFNFYAYKTVAKWFAREGISVLIF